MDSTISSELVAQTSGRSRISWELQVVPTSAAENFRHKQCPGHLNYRPALVVEGRGRISETYGIRKTVRGFPGALSQISSMVESATVFVAICSLAGTTASKTFLIESSRFGKGTLLTPLPIN